MFCGSWSIWRQEMCCGHLGAVSCHKEQPTLLLSLTPSLPLVLFPSLISHFLGLPFSVTGEKEHCLPFCPLVFHGRSRHGGSPSMGGGGSAFGNLVHVTSLQTFRVFNSDLFWCLMKSLSLFIFAKSISLTYENNICHNMMSEESQYVLILPKQ